MDRGGRCGGLGRSDEIRRRPNEKRAIYLAKTQGPFIAKIKKAGEVTSVYDFTDYRP